MSVNKQIKDLINEFSPQESPFYFSTQRQNTLNNLNGNNLYKSSQTKINKSYLVYTSQNKLHSKNKNINLLIPANSLSYLEKNSKIKREIQNMNKNLGIVNSHSLNLNNPKDLFTYTFNKEKNENFGKFRNRPVLNLNNEGLDFSSKKTINKQINRNLIEPGIFNATEKLKEKEAIENFGGKRKFISLFDKNNNNYSSRSYNLFKRSEQKDKAEFNKFMGEMNRFKQRTIKQWKNQFIEDNNKY